jgi:hypothetical protein
MKLKLPYSRSVRRLRRGFTILEMWISMTIGTMCLGAVGVIYLEMAKAQRSGLANAVLEQKADNLQDQLTSLFRTMSATTSATLGEASSSNSAAFYRAVVSKGVGQPQESIRFVPANNSVRYDPNINVAGNSRAVWTSEADSVILRECYFSLGLKAGNRPDGSLVTVTFRMDDDYAGRRRSGAAYKVNEINRQFTIRLRGP